MLTILQIGKTQDFFNYEELHAGELTIVTPNPAAADLVRKTFNSLERRVNSITISKFMKEELNSLFDEDQLLNFRGKSELSLLLGAIWKKIDRGDDFVGFQKAFNLLTELRSFSMSEQVFETVLEHYDDYTAEGVLWMHKLLEQMNIIDEHKSYFQLSERLRSPEFPIEKPTERNIVFYGFDYMTASQVDLMKSLSLRDEIFIPVYKKAYLQAEHSDWIKWFDTHNLRELDLSTNIENKIILKYKNFSKGSLSSSLKEFKDVSYIVLGTKKLTPEFIQEVPLENLAFKTDADLFSEPLNAVFNKIEEVREDASNLSDLKSFLLNLLNNFREQKMFRELKCTMTFLVKINEWENISEDNIDFGVFEFEILKEATKLDAPRISLTSLMKEHQHFVKSLSDLEEIKNQNVVLAVNGLHQSIKGINANYSEGVEKYLSSIGPLRRAEFEVNMFKERFREFIEDNQVTLLLESGLLEHDMSWNKILKSYELKETNDSFIQNYHNRLPLSYKDRQPYELATISASKLQRFYDCPMKFYYSYVENLLPRLDYPDEVSVLDLGNIEHKTIEEYFKRYDVFEVEKHEKLIFHFLNEVVVGKTISSELQQEYFVEVKSYTEKAIQKIFELKKELNLEVKFEFPFKTLLGDITYRGSVDCLLRSDDLDIVIDFKRSGGSFPSFKTILNFDQVQLWFYLKRLGETGVISHSKQTIFGYMNLSDNENSMFFVNYKESLEKWKKDFNFKKVNLISDLGDLRSKYNDLEEILLQNIRNEKCFLPKPRKVETCSYCQLNSICPRGDYGNS